LLFTFSSMPILRFLLCCFLITAAGCTPPPEQAAKGKLPGAEYAKVDNNTLTSMSGALLATRFQSMDELQRVVQIDYFDGSMVSPYDGKAMVLLRHVWEGQEVRSILKAGLSEADIERRAKGGFWSRVKLAIDTPYFAIYRNDFSRVFSFSRRRGNIFGEGDIAFYDLAETMVYHICDEELVTIPSDDLSEKGYLNTFNHINAQAFMTTLFSERLADFIADLHERRNLPELVTGRFSEEQISDREKGPVDNYIDLINNEYGQELGKALRQKYAIERSTHWTPELLADYLNDIQRYYSRTFQIGFIPFRATDRMVVHFANKINVVMKNPPRLVI
jgi:hypothetical protein